MERTQTRHYSRQVYFDPDDREYVALCTEFPHLSAFGDTPEEALADLDVALEGAIEVHRDEGWPIPEPAAPPPVEPLPSGRFLARVPKSLHARLTSEAKKEGVSLNTLVITLLAESLVSRERAAASHAGEREKAIRR